MAYKVESASGHTLEPGEKLFLDANIWINILSPPVVTPYKVKQYFILFEKILARNDVKIMVPLMLMSEVINRIIKDVYFYTFAEKNGLSKDKIPGDYYKKVFRPSPEYINSFKELTDEFSSYARHIEFVDDGLEKDVTKDSVLNNIDQYFDFNDNFYYQLALQRGYAIVTDDKDFWRENVVIITGNQTLLDKQTKINIEKNAGKKVTPFGTFKVENRTDKKP